MSEPQLVYYNLSEKQTLEDDSDLSDDYIEEVFDIIDQLAKKYKEIQNDESIREKETDNQKNITSDSSRKRNGFRLKQWEEVLQTPTEKNRENNFNFFNNLEEIPDSLTRTSRSFNANSKILSDSNTRIGDNTFASTQSDYDLNVFRNYRNAEKVFRNYKFQQAIESEGNRHDKHLTSTSAIGNRKLSPGANKYRNCIKDIRTQINWLYESEDEVLSNEVMETNDSNFESTASESTLHEDKSESLEIINTSETEFNKLKCQHHLATVLEQLKEKRKDFEKKFTNECRKNDGIKEKWRMYKANERIFEMRYNKYEKSCEIMKKSNKILCGKINKIMNILERIQNKYRISGQTYHLNLMKLHPKQRKTKELEYSILIMKSLKLKLEKTKENIEVLETNIENEKEELEDRKYRLNPVKECKSNNF